MKSRFIRAFPALLFVLLFNAQICRGATSTSEFVSIKRLYSCIPHSGRRKDIEPFYRGTTHWRDIIRIYNEPPIVPPYPGYTTDVNLWDVLSSSLWSSAEMHYGSLDDTEVTIEIARDFYTNVVETARLYLRKYTDKQEHIKELRQRGVTIYGIGNHFYDLSMCYYGSLPGIIAETIPEEISWQLFYEHATNATHYHDIFAAHFAGLSLIRSQLYGISPLHEEILEDAMALYRYMDALRSEKKDIPETILMNARHSYICRSLFNMLNVSFKWISEERLAELLEKETHPKLIYIMCHSAFSTNIRSVPEKAHKRIALLEKYCPPRDRDERRSLEHLRREVTELENTQAAIAARGMTESELTESFQTGRKAYEAKLMQMPLRSVEDAQAFVGMVITLRQHYAEHFRESRFSPNKVLSRIYDEATPALKEWYWQQARRKGDIDDPLHASLAFNAAMAFSKVMDEKDISRVRRLMNRQLSFSTLEAMGVAIDVEPRFFSKMLASTMLLGSWDNHTPEMREAIYRERRLIRDSTFRLMITDAWEMSEKEGLKSAEEETLAPAEKHFKPVSPQEVYEPPAENIISTDQGVLHITVSEPSLLNSRVFSPNQTLLSSIQISGLTLTYNPIPTGTYYLYNFHLDVWYSNTPFYAFASPIHVYSNTQTEVYWELPSASVQCVVFTDDAEALRVTHFSAYLEREPGTVFRNAQAHNAVATLDGVGNGAWYLRVVPDDTVAYYTTYYPSSTPDEHLMSFTIEDAQDVVLTTYVHRAHAQATGVVTFADAPVNGARIEWHNAAGKLYTTSSGEDGSYALALRTGDYTAVCHRKNTGWAYADTPVTVNLNDIISQNFDLAGVTVAGHVTNFAHITTPENITVFAFDAPEFSDLQIRNTMRMTAEQRYPHARCAHDGSFIITGLATGMYRICAQAYPTPGFHTAWGYHPAARVFEDAIVLTATHAHASFTDISVGYGAVPPIIGVITTVVFDATYDLPASGIVFSTSHDRNTSNAEGQIYLPYRTTNTAESTRIDAIGYAGIMTNSFHLHQGTVYISRVSTVFLPPNTDIFPCALTLIDADTHTPIETFRILPSRLHVEAPSNIPFLLFFHSHPLYENTFAQGALSVTSATHYILQEGEWLHVDPLLHPRLDTVTTTVYLFVDESIDIACLAVPDMYSINRDNMLVLSPWTVWNTPDNATFDPHIHIFSWTFDGEERDVIVGRFPLHRQGSNFISSFSLLSSSTYDFSGAGTRISYKHIPEPHALIPLFLVILARFIS